MNKAKGRGGDGILAELFQILKDNPVKSAALNMPANLENSAVTKGLEMVSFHPNAKNAQTTAQLHSFHMEQSNAQNSPS